MSDEDSSALGVTVSTDPSEHGERDTKSIVKLSRDDGEETKRMTLYYDESELPDGIGSLVDWERVAAEALSDDDWSSVKVEETFSWDPHREAYV